jgi:lysophospholipase L1-like esterase
LKRRTFITGVVALAGFVAACEAGLAQLRGPRRRDALPPPPSYTPAEAAAERSRALARFWQALSGRNATPCDIVFVGDSVTEGFVPWGTSNSLLTNQAWRVKLQDLLRGAYRTSGAGGSPGYYSAFRMSAPPPDYPVRYAGRAANLAGLGLRSVLLTAAEHYVEFTAPSPCTSVDIFWGGAPMTGAFSYQVNDRTFTDPVVTTVNGAEEDFHSTRVAGLSGGEVIRVTHAGGGLVVVDGFYAYNGDEARGLRGWDASQTGVPCTALVAEANQRWFRAFEVIQPSLVLIEIGGNDSRQRTAAQVGEDVRELIDLIKARCAKVPSFVVMGLWSPNWTARDPWESYNDAFRSIAAADDAVGYFDLRTVIKKTSLTDTIGGLLPDSVHPGPRASEMMAAALFEAIRPAMDQTDARSDSNDRTRRSN